MQTKQAQRKDNIHRCHVESGEVQSC